MSLILRLLGNSLALWAAQYFVIGFEIIGGLKGYLIAGIVLGFLNLIVRPIIRALAFPVILLTLGLFNIVINAALIWGVSELTPYVFFDNYYSLFWATVVVGTVNVFISLFRKAA